MLTPIDAMGIGFFAVIGMGFGFLAFIILLAILSAIVDTILRFF